jgi:small subunit ribosomal protein S15
MHFSKKKIFKKYGGFEENTGSTQSQIALLSFRINHLNKHLELNKKDLNSERALVNLVGKRKRLLKYLKKNKSLDDYDIEKLKKITL